MLACLPPYHPAGWLYTRAFAYLTSHKVERPKKRPDGLDSKGFPLFFTKAKGCVISSTKGSASLGCAIPQPNSSAPRGFPRGRAEREQTNTIVRTRLDSKIKSDLPNEYVFYTFNLFTSLTERSSLLSAESTPGRTKLLSPPFSTPGRTKLLSPPFLHSGTADFRFRPGILSFHSRSSKRADVHRSKSRKILPLRKVKHKITYSFDNLARNLITNTIKTVKTSSTGLLTITPHNSRSNPRNTTYYRYPRSNTSLTTKRSGPGSLTRLSTRSTPPTTKGKNTKTGKLVKHRIICLTSSLTSALHNSRSNPRSTTCHRYPRLNTSVTASKRSGSGPITWLSNQSTSPTTKGKHTKTEKSVKPRIINQNSSLTSTLHNSRSNPRSTTCHRYLRSNTSLTTTTQTKTSRSRTQLTPPTTTGEHTATLQRKKQSSTTRLRTLPVHQKIERNNYYKIKNIKDNTHKCYMNNCLNMLACLPPYHPAGWLYTWAIVQQYTVVQSLERQITYSQYIFL